MQASGVPRLKILLKSFGLDILRVVLQAYTSVIKVLLMFIKIIVNVHLNMLLKT